jgi:two-component system, LytTR family, response regulator
MGSQERARAFASRAVDGVVHPIRVARPVAASGAPLEPRAARRQGSSGPHRFPPLEVLVGEREHRLYVLEPEGIEYIESQDNYVKFHSGGVAYISRDSVKRLAAVLSGSGFVRIERSLLLNVRAIVYAQRAGRGTYSFTLLSGSVVRSGQKYRAEILRVLPLAHRSQRE